MSSTGQTTLIQVFARAPEPGRCKTRLARQWGARGAAAWHRRMVDKALHTALALRADVELWTTPRTDHPYFLQLRQRHPLRIRRQPPGPLGRRMCLALNDAGKRGYTTRLLIGTDCPALSPEVLDAATGALQTADCVLTPATDGGFVLLGARRPIPPRLLAGVNWSSGRELRQSLVRLSQGGIGCALTPRLWDVDHPIDLRRARRAHLL